MSDLNKAKAMFLLFLLFGVPVTILAAPCLMASFYWDLFKWTADNLDLECMRARERKRKEKEEEARK